MWIDGRKNNYRTITQRRQLVNGVASDTRYNSDETAEGQRDSTISLRYTRALGMSNHYC